jgi:hypothetical protein
MNIAAVIESFHDPKDLIGGRSSGQLYLFGMHAQFHAGSYFYANIDLRCRIITNQDYRQSGLDTASLQSAHLKGNLCLDLLRQFASVDPLSQVKASSVWIAHTPCAWV